DHQLLNQLSAQSEGKLFYPTQADELIKTIKQNASIKPVIYKQEEVKSWINLKWIFFIVLGFLSVEWFMRKWNGSV
ncbi:MAG: VWA domain-containing protein, partial [Bacteroidota bacterium]